MTSQHLPLGRRDPFCLGCARLKVNQIVVFFAPRFAAAFHNVVILSVGDFTFFVQVFHAVVRGVIVLLVDVGDDVLAGHVAELAREPNDFALLVRARLRHANVLDIRGQSLESFLGFLDRFFEDDVRFAQGLNRHGANEVVHHDGEGRRDRLGRDLFAFHVLSIASNHDLP